MGIADSLLHLARRSIIRPETVISARPSKLGFTVDGAYLGVVAGETVQVFDARTWTPVASVAVKGSLPWSFCFSSDGSSVIVVDLSGQAYAYEWRTEREIWSHFGGDHQVVEAAFDRNGELVVITWCGPEKQIRLSWPLSSRNGMTLFDGSRSEGDLCYGEIAAALSPDANIVACVCEDERILRLWDCEKATPVAEFPWHGHEQSYANRCWKVVISPNAKYIAYKVDRSAMPIAVFDIESARRAYFLWGEDLAHADPLVTDIAFSSDNRFLLAGTFSSFKFWDLQALPGFREQEYDKQTESELFFWGPGSGGSCCAIIPSGRFLVMGWSGGHTEVWDMSRAVKRSPSGWYSTRPWSDQRPMWLAPRAGGMALPPGIPPRTAPFYEQYSWECDIGDGRRLDR